MYEYIQSSQSVGANPNTAVEFQDGARHVMWTERCLRSWNRLASVCGPSWSREPVEMDLSVLQSCLARRE